jgi:hypothetical protein
MKRISTYKMFENKFDVKSFVDECLVDLIHDDMTVLKQLQLNDSFLVMYLYYDNDKTTFDFDKVKEDILFLISMMSEKDWDLVNISYRIGDRWSTLVGKNTLVINEIISDFHVNKIQSVSLKFDLNKHKYIFK